MSVMTNEEWADFLGMAQCFAKSGCSAGKRPFRLISKCLSFEEAFQVIKSYCDVSCVGSIPYFLNMLVRDLEGSQETQNIYAYSGKPIPLFTNKKVLAFLRKNRIKHRITDIGGNRRIRYYAG